MLQVLFCGTRGYIEESSRLHRMHSACLLLYRGRRLLLDCGESWAGRLAELAPDWIAITHAHPDHAFGLRAGTDKPVYVSQDSYRLLERFTVSRFRVFQCGRPLRLGPFRVEPYEVVHSLRAPAVGFRVSVGRLRLAYNPDIVAVSEPDAVLPGVGVYIGDGSSLTRPLVRRRGEALFGHTTVRAQLNWCKRYGIPRAYFVHCGKSVVEMNSHEAQRRVDEMAGDALTAIIARDGMRIRLAT